MRMMAVRRNSFTKLLLVLTGDMNGLVLVYNPFMHVLIRYYLTKALPKGYNPLLHVATWYKLKIY